MSRFKFSLRTLLAAVAAVGIGAALWVAEPSWQVGAIEALLLGWVLGSTAALSVHCKGKAKTFWIGITAECVWPVFVYLSEVLYYSGETAEGQGNRAMMGDVVCLGRSDSRRASTIVAGERSRCEWSLSHGQFDIGAIAGSLC